MKMILVLLYLLKLIRFIGFCDIVFVFKFSFVFCMNCCLCRVIEEVDLILE